MFKLLFGITLGAILMYLFDPSQGRDRRDALTQRASKTAGNLPEVKEEARATVTEAKERARSAISHTRERVGETIDEARNEVNGFAKSTHERVETVTGNGQTESAPNS